MSTPDRLRVSKTGGIWYGQCPRCPLEADRIRSPHLSTTHSKSMRHAAKHKAEER